MSLPGDLSTVTVTATYLDLATGDPATGAVTFTPTRNIALATDPDQFLMARPLNVALDEDGQLSVVLAVTDDPQYEPEFAWRVTEKVGPGSRAPYLISLPVADAGTTVDLAELTPVAELGTYSAYMPTAGGTFQGDVDFEEDVDVTGALVAGSAEIGLAGVEINSTFGGGENTTDSTGRLQLHSHQRAQGTNSFGEVVRIDLERDNAKAMITWRENYTPTAQAGSPRPVAWIGAHGQSNDGLTWHNHISLEVPDETGALQSQFEIPFAEFDEENGYGISASAVYCRSIAKFIAGSGVAIVEGAAGSSRDLTLSSADATNVGGKDADRRWSVRADGTAEAGSNVGSDFNIVRRSDSGVLVDSPIFIKRSNGNVGIGPTVSAPASALQVESNGGKGVVMVKATAVGTATIPTFAIETSGTTKRGLDYRVTGDGVSRIRFDMSAGSGSGTITFGDGTTADTNLYRSAADTLKTDDSFHVGATLRHLGSSLGFYNATAISKPSVTGSRGSNAALASLLTALANLGLLTDSSS